MRIVLDTNIIVSGFLSENGYPGRLLIAWLEGEFRLVTSSIQLNELERVLRYDRLRGRYDPMNVAEFLDNLPARADVLDGEALPQVNVSPDPDDNPILAAALAGNADLIVSGDKSHMLGVGSVEGIPIVTPANAFERLASGS